MLAIIERWKDRGLTPERVSAGEAGDFARGRGVELYKAYQERLRRLNACDFGDLLLHNLTLFQTQSEVLADYHRRFRYILVDEYQDTNVSQYLRSEEHTSELQSLMRISYAVFCLKKKKLQKQLQADTKDRNSYSYTIHMKTNQEQNNTSTH